MAKTALSASKFHGSGCRILSQGFCSDQPEAKKLIAAEAELEVCIAKLNAVATSKLISLHRCTCLFRPKPNMTPPPGTSGGSCFHLKRPVT